jgi:hypothetical protein
MAAKRTRAGVSADELSTLLAPYCTGRRRLHYGEKPKDPAQRLMIITHKNLINELKDKLGDNLNLVKCITDEAFLSIVADKGDSWRLPVEEHKDWAQAMSNRLRLMLRHTSQALIKRTKWAVEAFGGKREDEGEDGEEEEAEGEEEEEEEEDEEAEEEADKKKVAKSQDKPRVKVKEVPAAKPAKLGTPAPSTASALASPGVATPAASAAYFCYLEIELIRSVKKGLWSGVLCCTWTVTARTTSAS